MGQDYFKGRGAQIKIENKFLKAQYVMEHIEGLDEPLLENPSTQIFQENAKKILNRVDSPDLGFGYSMNPYQGCENGCIYCYARNTHEYYGFSAGLDFESKIIVKRNAPQLLEKELLRPTWNAVPIMLSGNTDCYQPQEKKF
ncbi:MAG: radical SAM protein, partial [Cytophagales bacterium]